MAGGLLQLVAYGAQDVYISGNPHITFWKILYKRHTNFAMEAFRVNFTGAPAFGQRVVAVVNRNADLIGRTYLEVTLPQKDTLGNDIDPFRFWNDEQNRFGYLLIKQVEVEIGGQIIDRHYGEWLYLWECLTASYHENNKLLWMTSARMTSSSTTTCKGRPRVLYIPLQFWFCRNPGLALPLIALQYHEVRFNITFNDVANIIRTTTATHIQVDRRAPEFTDEVGTGTVALCPTTLDASLYIDYVYLDTEERRRFAQQSHEYLIEQLQYNENQTITHSSSRIDLTFNHPVKELVWVFQSATRTDCSNNGTVSPFTYDDIINRGRIQLNGQDRFDERYGDYFWKIQPFQHHTGGLNIGSAATDYSALPVVEGGPYGAGQSGLTLGLVNGQTNGAGQRVAGLGLFYNPINVYSFALKPEEHQPSGTCNFSRIDNATLVFDSVTAGAAGSFPSKETPFSIRMYAVSYNILRIMSGMGGLAYSN